MVIKHDILLEGFDLKANTGATKHELSAEIPFGLKRTAGYVVMVTLFP